MGDVVTLFGAVLEVEAVRRMLRARMRELSASLEAQDDRAGAVDLERELRAACRLLDQPDAELMANFRRSLDAIGATARRLFAEGPGRPRFLLDARI